MHLQKIETATRSEIGEIITREVLKHSQGIARGQTTRITQVARARIITTSLQAGIITTTIVTTTITAENQEFSSGINTVVAHSVNRKCVAIGLSKLN